jgi:hypothetical protein
MNEVEEFSLIESITKDDIYSFLLPFSSLFVKLKGVTVFNSVLIKIPSYRMNEQDGKVSRVLST